MNLESDYLPSKDQLHRWQLLFPQTYRIINNSSLILSKLYNKRNHSNMSRDDFKKMKEDSDLHKIKTKIDDDNSHDLKEKNNECIFHNEINNEKMDLLNNSINTLSKSRKYRQQLRIEDLIGPLTELTIEKDILFQELNEEEEDYINDIIKTYRNSDDCIINKYRIKITYHDVETLLGLHWLNDQVVNFFIQEMMELYTLRNKKTDIYIHNSHFFSALYKQGFNSVKRWSKKFDTFSLSKLFIPVNVSNTHWTLVYANISSKQLCYYDSMGLKQSRYTNIVLEYLKQESMDKKQIELDTSKWTIIEPMNQLPQQNNCSDCGVFMLSFIYTLLFDLDFDFSYDDMPNIRKRLFYSITKGSIDENLQDN